MAVMEFHITLPAELDEYERYYQILSMATVEELAEKGLVPVPPSEVIPLVYPFDEE